jgi:hypothetical protein
MTNDEFDSWLRQHAAMFDSVRTYARADTLTFWRAQLANTAYVDAISASHRLYESDNQPRNVSSHAAHIKRIARTIAASRRNANPDNGWIALDAEAQLRKRHEDEWERASQDVRDLYISRALETIASTPNMKDVTVSRMVHTIALTIFAESREPAEAERIERLSASSCQWHCSDEGIVYIIDGEKPLAVLCACPKGDRTSLGMRRLQPARDTLDGRRYVPAPKPVRAPKSSLIDENPF